MTPRGRRLTDPVARTIGEKSATNSHARARARGTGARALAASSTTDQSAPATGTGKSVKGTVSQANHVAYRYTSEASTLVSSG